MTPSAVTRPGRAVYDAILAHLRSLGPVHEDAVGVGVFLKRDRKLAEVRPRSRDVSLALYLPRLMHDPRITRVLGAGAPRVVHLLLLRDAEEVDDQVRGWLTEAFLHASGWPAGCHRHSSPAAAAPRRHPLARVKRPRSVVSREDPQEEQEHVQRVEEDRCRDQWRGVEILRTP